MSKPSAELIERWRGIRQAWQRDGSVVWDVPADRWTDPYWDDENGDVPTMHFSKAEEAAWSSIRCYGGAVLYPQVPVSKWFIDFGDPRIRIGLEVDGAAYHDPQRDGARDECLWAEHGWRIFRAPAKEFCAPLALRLYNQYHDRVESLAADGLDDCDLHDGLRVVADNFMMYTGEGLLVALADRYFDYRADSPLQPFVYSTLDRHRLAAFPI